MPLLFFWVLGCGGSQSNISTQESIEPCHILVYRKEVITFTDEVGGNMQFKVLGEDRYITCLMAKLTYRYIVIHNVFQVQLQLLLLDPQHLVACTVTTYL